jgi:hypothetical protein
MKRIRRHVQDDQGRPKEGYQASPEFYCGTRPSLHSMPATAHFVEGWPEYLYVLTNTAEELPPENFYGIALSE